MDDLLNDIASHGHDPLIEAENASERMIRSIRRLEASELAREKFQADISFSKLPYWVQQTEEGDYMADGSDLQGWDFEDLEKEEGDTQ